MSPALCSGWSTTEKQAQAEGKPDCLLCVFFELQTFKDSKKIRINKVSLQRLSEIGLFCHFEVLVWEMFRL